MQKATTTKFETKPEWGVALTTELERLRKILLLLLCL
jgi:hypothetical protein